MHGFLFELQPLPLQTSSLFAGSAPSNTPSVGPVGVGNAPRHINIHIHAGRLRFHLTSLIYF